MTRRDSESSPRIDGARALLAALALAAGGCGSGGQRAAAGDAGSAGDDAGSTDDGGPAGDAGAAPGDAGGAPGVPVAITITPGDLTLAPVGASALRAEAHDGTGAVVAVDFTWHSSDESIATVDDGVVSGVAVGQAQVTASAAGLTSAPANVRVAVGSSTSDLLAKAVAAGEITADQALVYEVLAMFGDPGLPDKYRGTATGQSLQKDLLMVNAASRFDALTAEQQAAIGPYFVPPAYASGAATATAPLPPGTEADIQRDRPGFCSGLGVLQGDWVNVPTANFRVWWNSKTLSVAADFVDDIELAAESAYKRYVDELHLNPFLDDTKLPPGSQDLPPWLCNGGDGRLDIYIVDNPNALTGAYGVTVPEDSNWGSGGLARAFILLSPNVLINNPSSGVPKRLKAVVAHEVFHAVQFSYLNLGTASFRWVLEATATWAEDSAFPSYQDEHRFDRPFLDRMDQPLFYPNQSCLGSTPGAICGTDPGADLKMYGAHMFFQWATRTIDDGVIGRFFDASTSDSLSALQDALGKPLRQAWSDFVLAAWNGGEVPETQVFQVWDDQIAKVKPNSKAVTLGNPVGPAVSLTAPTLIRAGETVAKDVELSELSAVYDRYAIVDPAVRSLIFYNGFTQNMGSITVNPQASVGPSPHIVTQSLGTQVIAYDTTAAQRAGRHLWALLKIEDPASPDGKWTVKDWTAETFVPLCLDKASERVQELVLIFSNGDFTTARTGNFTDNSVAAIGDQAAVLVASPVPCWKYRGTFDTAFDYKDAMDSFSMASTLSATYVMQQPYIQATTAKGVPGTVLRAWRFSADPATVALTRTLKQSCGAGDMQQSGAEFFTSGVPGFDSVLPYPPIGSAYGAIWNADLYARNYVQWPIQRCDGTTASSPFVDPLNFDLYFTSWQTVDLAMGRFASPQPDGAKSPVVSVGSFAGAGEVTNTWCLEALREGDPVLGLCP